MTTFEPSLRALAAFHSGNAVLPRAVSRVFNQRDALCAAARFYVLHTTEYGPELSLWFFEIGATIVMNDD